MQSMWRGVAVLLAMATCVASGCAPLNTLELREFVRVNSVVATSGPEPGKFLVALAFTDGERLLDHLREGDDRTQRLLEPVAEWDGEMSLSLAAIEINSAQGGVVPFDPSRGVEVRAVEQPRALLTEDNGIGFVVCDEAGREIAIAWVIDDTQFDWSKSGN